MDAINYPTITIGDKTLVVRFSLAAQVLLGRRGIDIRQLSALLDKENPQGAENLVKIFAACVAENFIDQSNPATCSLGAAPSADYWAMQLGGRLQDAANSIVEAMGKAAEALQKGLAVVPPARAAS
jgi:hypothetical protein